MAKAKTDKVNYYTIKRLIIYKPNNGSWKGAQVYGHVVMAVMIPIRARVVENKRRITKRVKQILGLNNRNITVWNSRASSKGARDGFVVLNEDKPYVEFTRTGYRMQRIKINDNGE